MRWSFLLLVAACSPAAVRAPLGPAAPPPAPREFVVSVRAPGVGETTHERAHSVQKVTITRGTEHGEPHVNDTTSTYDDTVDAVAGLAVMRVKAAVTDVVSDSLMPSRNETLQVVAALEDGRVVVRDRAGAVLGEPYAHELGDHYRILGRPEPFLVHVPAEPLRAGNRVPEYEAALSERFRRDSADAVGGLLEAHVEVIEADAIGTEAKLAWRARLAGKQYGFDLEGTLDGTMLVRRDGLLAHIGYEVRAHGRAADGTEVGIESAEEHDYTYDRTPR